MHITKNTVVSIRFRMETTAGDVLEDIMDEQPLNYIHGSGEILPALEEGLSGLKAGERKSIFISKENGYSGLDDDYSVEVVVDQVRPATEDELARGLSPDQDNEACDEGCCC